MRHILFRAKTLKEGRWVNGDLVNNRLEGRSFIHEQTGEMTEIDLSTVGQATGIRDTNGTEIYEGDILHFEGRRDDNRGKHYRRPVVWSDGGFKMQLEDGTTGAPLRDMTCHLWNICGTVHDNQ